MKNYEVGIYIFGELRTISFEADESFEELRQDYDLLNGHILGALEEMMRIQEDLKESNYE